MLCLTQIRITVDAKEHQGREWKDQHQQVQTCNQQPVDSTNVKVVEKKVVETC